MADVSDHPPFDVAVVTPDGPVFGRGPDADRARRGGEIGIRARHAPLATLKAGSTRVHLGDNEILEFATGPGFFKVELDRASPRRRRRQRQGDRRRPRAGAARRGEGGAQRWRPGVDGRSLAARRQGQARREPALGLGSHDRLSRP